MSTAMFAGSGGGINRNDFTAKIGCKFVVGASDITVSDVGRIRLSGNSGAHTVRIYNSGGTQLASALVNVSSGTLGAYQYTTIGTPIVLTAGSTYYLLSDETNGGDIWGDDGFAGLTLAGGIASITSCYNDGAFHDVSANQTYVPPNLLYTLGGSPTTPTLASPAVANGGTTLTATLNQAGCIPASGTGGFTVAGTSAAVTSWAISGSTLTLNLSGVVLSSDTVTYSYDRATTVDDISESTAAAFLANFTGTSVTNNSTQAAPTKSSPTVPTGGTTLTMTLSQSGCGPASGTGGFTLSGTSATVASFAISGTTLTLTLSGTVLSTDSAVKVSYDRSTTTDDVHNASGLCFLANFTTAAVTNNSTQVGGGSLSPGVASWFGSTPTTITLHATDATSGTAPYTYQWQRSADGGATWGNLSGKTSLTPMADSTPVENTAYSYRLKYTDADLTVVYSNVLAVNFFYRMRAKAGLVTSAASGVAASLA